MERWRGGEKSRECQNLKLSHQDTKVAKRTRVKKDFCFFLVLLVSRLKAPTSGGGYLYVLTFSPISPSLRLSVKAFDLMLSCLADLCQYPASCFGMEEGDQTVVGATPGGCVNQANPLFF